MITEKFNDLFDFAKKSKIKAGDGLKEGLYPFYTSSAKLSKRIDVFQEDKISLIFGTGGKASIHYVNEQFSTSTDCIVVIKKEDKAFNEKFVYYYLFGNIHILERGFKGAGLKHISKKYIQNLDIPMLPIENQNKIVALLDKASALVQKRGKSITQLDELLRAQFLDMFGDPILNPKGWEVMTISKVIKEMKGGWSIGGEYRGLKENELGVLKISAVTSGHFRENEFKAVSKDKINRVLVYPKKGDLLFSRANTKEMVGSTCLIPRDYDNLFLPDKLWKLIPNEELISTFFLKPVLSNVGVRKEISKLATGTGGSMKNISKAKLNKMEIPIPPIELQNQFETIYHNIQAQKETLIQSKTGLENLYNSLVQGAFKGEIETSKQEVKKKESIMPEQKKKEGEKIDITNLTLESYYNIPEEIVGASPKWMFDHTDDDIFYQFLLINNFNKEVSFTLQDIEGKLQDLYYHVGDIDFDIRKWQTIILKFLEFENPLLEQIFDEDTATVKLKLTDETYKA